MVRHITRIGETCVKCLLESPEEEYLVNLLVGLRKVSRENGEL
jgi:hypothetical protein